MTQVPSLSPAQARANESDDPNLKRLEARSALEPGQYWRLKTSITVKNPHSSFYSDEKLHEGDMHLITKLFEFEGALHSVTILEHPREANKDRFANHTLLTADFLQAFDPVPMDEALAIRAQEQADVMSRVQAVQEEMRQAQLNPLALPGVQEAARKAVETFEANETARVQSEVKDMVQRESDLRRIHRRAARRSEAKGNPLAVRKATISDRLDVMISEGVTSDGVRELQLEAGRRMAIAEVTSKWLAERSKRMSELLECITPYLAEHGQLALASAHGAIERVAQIERGITSLKLYTGDGVAVIPVREGVDAPTHEPLTLVQEKLAMDEELAVHADVDDEFDCTSQEIFFKRLSTDEQLLAQILPAPRCVVSMQITRRAIEYGKDVHPFEAVARALENKRVFLLVRNGQNVHAVYSTEPSHEAAKRLFPTEDEIHEPFKGIDGSSIGLQDVAFGKASGRFEDQALHYRRFLILLCGLDHRMNLFGEFFPPEEKSNFMSQVFQQRFFRFLENDDPGRLIGGQTESVREWMQRHNSQLRSGSRVVVQSGSTLRAAAPHIARVRDLQIDQTTVRKAALIAGEKSGNLFLNIPTIKGLSKSGTARAWLTGPDAYKNDRWHSWFLCIDRVKVAEVRRHIYDRSQRIGSIAWLRTLRRVEQQLVADDVAQTELRAYLRESALEAQVHTPASVDEAIDTAVATWRADHRGAPAPVLGEAKAVEQLLSLIFPKGYLTGSLRPIIDALCQREDLQPLMLTRTGKSQFALYSLVPEADKASYSTGVAWGWVRRHLIKVGRDRASLGSSSTVWLQHKTLEATEEIVIRWPELDAWVHQEAEPCRLATLAKIKAAIADGQRVIEQITQARDLGSGLDETLLHGWLNEVSKQAARLSYSQTAYLSIPLGVYQLKKNSPPVILYARSTLYEIVRSHGTAQQKLRASQTKGMRSNWSRGELDKTDPIHWHPVTSTEFFGVSVDLGGRVKGSTEPAWSKVQTHKPGGYNRKMRNDRWRGGSTRAQRREAGGEPWHESRKVAVSWNRAIDALMGIQPLERRTFYKNVQERVDRIWGGITAEREQIAQQRKAERDRRFEPALPTAIELAACLWDPILGRSIANRYLCAKASLSKLIL